MKTFEQLIKETNKAMINMATLFEYAKINDKDLQNIFKKVK